MPCWSWRYCPFKCYMYTIIIIIYWNKLMPSRDYIYYVYINVRNFTEEIASIAQVLVWGPGSL